MKPSELINKLKQFDPDNDVVLFNEHDYPMRIKKVVVDTKNDGYFSYIIVEELK